MLSSRGGVWQVLRSYQNKTVAMDLVKELESYTSGGMSGELCVEAQSIHPACLSDL